MSRPDEHGNPQVVDLRMYSPHELGDVPITNADLKTVSLAALSAAAIDLQIPGVEIPREIEPAARIERGRGRPKELTDDCLRDVTRLARDARKDNRDINRYVAAGLAQKIGHCTKPETVRGWRKPAIARGRQSPTMTASSAAESCERMDHPDDHLCRLWEKPTKRGERTDSSIRKLPHGKRVARTADAGCRSRDR